MQPFQQGRRQYGMGGAGIDQGQNLLDIPALGMAYAHIDMESSQCSLRAVSRNGQGLELKGEQTILAAAGSVNAAGG